MNTKFFVIALASLILQFSTTAHTSAEVVLDQEPSIEASTPNSDSLEQAVEQGAAFLAKSQAADGSWSNKSGTGVTSLIAASLLANGRAADDPVVAKALTFLERNVRDTGGIHAVDSRYRNYETCLGIQCLLRANQDGKYDSVLKKAEHLIRDIQWDEEEGYNREHEGYGGAGYGSHNRPDLSNTSFLMETLNELGTDANDPAMYRALAFVSRTQNLPSEHNQTEIVKKNPDGGFYYTPIAGGASQAGETENGGLRSYGSMTYAGLKSMIYAGVDRDDPRVKAASEWIAKHYSLESNPGLGSAGLFYYYHTFAKALHALGKPTLTDAAGQKHNWRSELIKTLSTRQRPDGSWANDNERWLEADANLSTGYALMALSYCREPGALE
ncbi:prenyltransferase/squalene oxidase repeat-containing protein [Adhaeretor mobilis]|uniref:Squalene cyclase C-terminal domain-containing protein n=1 Tax=Adhaeretor mobilis TaxID=1930276 RepID=A0A517MPH6_9BACT|nr:prenyltransferase/squalene oxidase repeat-containing protein [Adhaeretor mobilis]QDS96785.1 hypothetical protein HG15A2_00430 [Adhaeretor mobilis]